MSDVALERATLDDKPAPLARNAVGMPVVFVGPGRHDLKLDILAPIDTAAAERTFSFRIPTPPATRLRLTVPGFVEIKSGATVIHRRTDEKQQVTHFELLPKPGSNSLVFSLNHRQLRKDRVLVAHSVLIDEITTAYERLHATVSVAVQHGATDQLRIVVPQGFEIQSVASPQVSRWSVAEEEPQKRKILDVRLREAINATLTLNVAAVRIPAPLAAWKMPALSVLDVAGDVTVLGLLVDEHLQARDLLPKNLISLDADVIKQALPASLKESAGDGPRLTPIAAFYAPRGEYQLTARFVVPPADLRVTGNLLLTLEEKSLQASGALVLTNAHDKLIAFDFAAPAGWQVSDVATGQGKSIPLETTALADGSRRIHVRLPEAVAAGQTAVVRFQAQSVPESWLEAWEASKIEVPVFHVAGAAHDEGVIAIRATHDLRAHPLDIVNLTSLDAAEAGRYGITAATTDLIFGHQAPDYSLSLDVERVAPRITARVYSFFVIQPDVIAVHGEVAYDVGEARTGSVAFALPDSTPAELAIRGLDGVAIKESRSEVVEGQRRWTVLLREAKRGAIRLAIDFQQPLAAGEGAAAGQAEQALAAQRTLPLFRAEGVVYQSGMVGVEGSPDCEVQITTSLRKIDVGELSEASYEFGRRLLGTYGYGGEQAEVKVTIGRPAGYELPTAIIERAELVTSLSAGGRSQTAARFALRAKAQMIEVELPAESTLWSVYLDGQPALPQREAAALLIALPAMAGVHDLRLAYETPIGPLDMLGNVDMPAPKLRLRGRGGARGDEVPLADLIWNVDLPGDQVVVRSSGTVYSDAVDRRVSPLVVLGETFSPFLSVSQAREAARRPSAANDMKQLGMAIINHHDNRKSSPALPQSAGEKTPAYGLTPLDDSTYGADEPAKEAGPADGEATATDIMGGNDDVRSEVQLKDSTESLSTSPPSEGKGKSGSDANDWKERANEFQLNQFDTFGRRPQKSLVAAGKSWALEGLRSMPIELQRQEHTTAFASLGDEPHLRLTLVNRARWNWLIAGVAAAVLLAGVWRTRQPMAARIRFVAGVLLVAYVLPLALPWTAIVSPLCNAAFYSACALVPYYIVAAVVRPCAACRLHVAAWRPIQRRSGSWPVR